MCISIAIDVMLSIFFFFVIILDYMKNIIKHLDRLSNNLPTYFLEKMLKNDSAVYCVKMIAPVRFAC